MITMHGSVRIRTADLDLMQMAQVIRIFKQKQNQNLNSQETHEHTLNEKF